jgi:hypothetical protein
MARGFNNWIEYLQSELDRDGSPAFRAAEKDLAFYNNFNTLGMCNMKLVVAGSPDTHNLPMPVDANGRLKLVRHLRVTSTLYCQRWWLLCPSPHTFPASWEVGGKGTSPRIPLGQVIPRPRSFPSLPSINFWPER